jgi:hypothetical protein
VRYIVSLCLTGLTLWLIGGTGAWAASSVERSSPFTDYRQAVTDQYATTAAPPPAPPTAGAQNPPVETGGGGVPEERAIGPVGADNQPVGVTPAADDAGNVIVGGGGRALPFTGFDLLALVLLGVLLVALGALLRAAQRARQAVRLARS